MDYFSGKISNGLNFWGMGTALLLSLVNDGMGGFMESFCNAGMVLCLMIPVYLLQGIGGGDVKAFLCVAAFLGFFASLNFIFAVLALGCAAGLGEKRMGWGGRTKVRLGLYMPLAHIILTGMEGWH